MAKKARTPRAKDAGSDVAALEARVGKLEKMMALVWDSSLGGQLRMLEAETIQRERDRESERAQAAEPRAADKARLARVADFAVARLAVHAELTATEKELWRAYSAWTRENRVPKAECWEDRSELAGALALMPDAERAEVHPSGYLGKPTYTEPGFAGIALLAEGEDSIQVVTKLEGDKARAKAERRDRREWHEHEASVEDAVVKTRRTRDEAARLAVEGAQK